MKASKAPQLMFGAFIHGKDILASIFKKPFNCVMISHLGRIVIDPEIMVGKPVIKGTRITVELILRLLAKGLKVDEILEDYPHLTKEDIRAALLYASKVLEM